jgi:hypothetical protein
LKLACAWILACLAATSVYAADVFTVDAALWDRPRSARAVFDQPGVQQAVALYLSRPGARLVLHHGYGQEPVLQAEELRLWLMALAVDGARVSLVNDIKPQESMKIEVVQ